MSPAHWLTQVIWRRQGFWGTLGWFALAPLATGFSAVVRGRNLLYDHQLLHIMRPALKVISVGNLTVGGTGKTPLVLWLAQALQARGHRVGILTRGYKGAHTETTVVGTRGEAQATPAEVGDEAVMLARTFVGVVIAGPDRVAAARLARTTFGLDVVILDDGFQHRRLGRDLDLLLFNETQEMDNGWLLPAGPLREPLTAAHRADVVIVTKGSTRRDCRRWLVVSDRKPVFFGDLKPTALIHSVHRKWQELPLTLLGHKRVVAVTGIADPLPFYRTLHEWEAEVAEVLAFPDHHAYTQADWQTISAVSQKFDLIVTTEKDLVKLERFPFAAGKLVAMRVRMELEHADRLLAVVERQLRFGTGKPLTAL